VSLHARTDMTLLGTLCTPTSLPRPFAFCFALPSYHTLSLPSLPAPPRPSGEPLF
jgi:hypothetical protein